MVSLSPLGPVKALHSLPAPGVPTVTVNERREVIREPSQLQTLSGDRSPPRKPRRALPTTELQVRTLSLGHFYPHVLFWLEHWEETEHSEIGRGRE